MDALALLCTLHADGPATWRRLREEGCNSLALLERLENARLATLLGSTPAVARRFVREARHLGERLGSGGLDREEPFGPTPSRPQAASAAQIAELVRPALPKQTLPTESTLSESMQRPTLGPNDQRLLDKVLSSWREHDAQPSPSAATPTISTATASASASAALSFALAPDLVDGLDERLCEFLHAEGVHTLADLTRIDATLLASQLSVGYTRLARISSLAKRKLALAGVLVPERPVRASLEKFSAAELPAEESTPDLLIPRPSPLVMAEHEPRLAATRAEEPEGAAGPFARG